MRGRTGLVNSNRNYEVFWGGTKQKRALEDRHASTAAYINYMRPRCLCPQLQFDRFVPMTFDIFPRHIRTHFEMYQWRHACAILSKDFPAELADLIDVLKRFRLQKSWISTGGGNKSPVSKWIDGELSRRGWAPKGFDTSILVDGATIDSPTHEVDCFKNRIALEIEWNNKDPFYDRDLNNFRLLFDLRVISVGIIITRSDELQRIFDDLGRGSSYGESTTHMSKLLPKIKGGGGAGCPLLVIGIKRSLYDENS